MPDKEPILENRSTISEWRRTEMRRMGFTDYQAEVLINVPGLNTADIRETYINKGCSVELAWRILSPHASSNSIDQSISEMSTPRSGEMEANASI